MDSFMEDMVKLKTISRQNGIEFVDLIKSMIKLGEKNNARSPGFIIFKRLALQPDFVEKEDIYKYDSSDFQARIKNSPLKFNMFEGIPNQEQLISKQILKTDFKTMTQIYELNVTIKKLPQFMYKEFETEIKKRLKLEDVSVLNIQVYKKAEDLYRILVHVINKNVVKSQEKRQQSRIQTEKYLEQLVKQTGKDVSQCLQYADVISNVSDPKIYNQEGGTCYAHAVAEAIYSTQARIKGRDLESHDKITQRIIKKHGKNGGFPQTCLKQQCPPKRLRYSKVDAQKACEAVLMGRVVIMQFYLSKKGWDDYSNYGQQGKSMKKLQKMHDPKQKDSGGHAVAIIGVDIKQKVWIIKNAWGTYDQKQNESIKYRRSIMKIKMNICHLEYFDVFFWESDLNYYEILSYQKYLKTKTKDERELEKRKVELMMSTSSYFSRKLTEKDEDQQLSVNLLVSLSFCSDIPDIPDIPKAKVRRR